MSFSDEEILRQAAINDFLLVFVDTKEIEDYMNIERSSNEKHRKSILKIWWCKNLYPVIVNS